MALSDAIINIRSTIHACKDLHLNIQTERLENHTARFTVEVDNERLEKAKRMAAGRLAKRVNIPGFRKGKAPYKVLLSYLGEGAILEDAVEVLGNEIYKDALDQSEIEPYGPGSLEDFKAEPQPTFQFIVPLQPSVNLGDYHSVRLPYEAPAVEDKAVDDAIENMRERLAVIEESRQPVAAGNRVTVSLTGSFLDEDPSDEEAETEGEEAAETGEETEPENKVFIQRDEIIFLLTPDREPAPGFTDALIGATVDERREFELTYPEDEEEFQNLSGRHVKFDVTVKKIETMTMPALNDDFAARITESEEKPLTLLELRMRTRENLQKTADERAQSEYSHEVLHEIIHGATVAFPEVLVDDQIQHLLQHVDSDLRQRGMTLDDYMKITGKTLQDLKNEYRHQAVETIEHALVQQELIKAEKIEIDDARINDEIEKIVSQFGEQADAFRKFYSRKDARENLRNDLTNRAINERIAAIAKGEVSDAGAAPTESAPPVSAESSEDPGQGEAS
jgi:trigger factor